MYVRSDTQTLDVRRYSELHAVGRATFEVVGGRRKLNLQRNGNFLLQFCLEILSTARRADSTPAFVLLVSVAILAFWLVQIAQDELVLERSLEGA